MGTILIIVLLVLLLGGGGGYYGTAGMVELDSAVLSALY